jgi:hypothetical protein
MAGRRNREKFGEALNCSQHNRFPQLFHARSPLNSTILGFIVVYGVGFVQSAQDMGEWRVKIGREGDGTGVTPSTYKTEHRSK